MSLGKSSNSTSSNSQSFSEANSASASNAFNQGGSRSFIDPTQAGALGGLYSGAVDAVGALGPDIAARGAAVGDAAYGQGQQFIGGLSGIADGSNPFISNLLARTSGSNPYLNNQIDALGADIGRNLQTNILPQIGSGFALANQYGGGRQGLAEGLALESAQREFGQGATALRSDAYNQGAEAAALALAAQTDAANVGLGGLGQQVELGLAGPLAGLLPLEQLQGLLGSPTILSDSFSLGGSTSASVSDAISRSESRSKGKGGSFNFGLPAA